jgi:hypothetical protein
MLRNYFIEYYTRYQDLKNSLGINERNAINAELVKQILENNSQDLNNLIMAGLGMGTLYLRMGAVLMIAEKTNKPAVEKDISFLKMIAEKLIHKLPADGEWKDIWSAYLTKDNLTEWKNIVDKMPSIPKVDGKIYESFVSFRNNIVHQDIIIKSGLANNQIEEILKGLKILDAMSSFRERFDSCIISFEKKEVYFQYTSNSEKLKISPYVQINKDKTPEDIGILPYLFQGKYYKGSKFINTEGAETKEEKDASIEEVFEKIKQDIAQFNGDKAFDFKEKIANYNEWCIGREDEVKDILKWINDAETDKNVLPIFAPAGLGKGALVAEVIKKLEEDKIRHLYHFCGSGFANNLQAILYHFILQGKEKKYWNINSLPSKFQNKLERLPSQYTDVIELFQTLTLSENEISENEISNALKNPNPDGRFNAIYNVLKKIIKKNDKNQLDELLNQYYINAKQLIDSRGHKLQTDYYNYIFDIHFSLTKFGYTTDLLELVPKENRELSKKFSQPLVIIIDGLDEAAVADHSKRISDWFYTYNDKGERAEKWIAPDHIKWIFTFRQTSKNNKEGFQFEYYEFKTHDLSEVQPLMGLSEDAVIKGLKEGFKDFEPKLTDEFIKKILEKGAVKENENIK